MTPALREELTDLRRILGTALARIDETLAVPGAVAKGRTPAAIVMLLEQTARAMSPREVHEALTRAGREVNEDAVYQALKRLAGAGKVERVGHGKYQAKERTA